MKIVLIAILLTVSIIPVFAESLISVETDKNSYNEGDTIVISGKVSTVIEGTPVTLQIFTQGNLVEIVQVKVAEDGTYSHIVVAEGSMWSEAGVYTVKVSFGEGNIAEDQFSFSPRSEISTTSIFEVDAGSYGTFDVDYSIGGGIVKNMLIDKDIFELIAVIESTSKGSMSLEIPREALDAKKQDGTDDIFIIVIDGIEAPYKETETNSNSRVITIDFEQGDSDIEIIGTHIVGSSVNSSPSVDSGISSNSIFRIIPEKPSVGSTIRVIGGNFGALQQFDFYINTDKIGTFETDEYGHFVTTVIIPKNQSMDRTNFSVIDESGNEKKISLRLGNMESRILEPEIPLTVKSSISSTVSVLTDQSSYLRGDIISVSGTVQNSNDDSVSLDIVDPDNVQIWKETVQLKDNGEFSTMLIAGDSFAVSGQYVLIATHDDATSKTFFSFQNGDDSSSKSPEIKVKSQYNSFKITSVQVTDQQGNPSTLQAGEMGFIKVNLDANKAITTLVTVNLFDSDLTSVGIGSIKTTLSSGNSEIILSFMIPDDVAVGSADIYVNAFSDWPSNGGIPLTDEVSVTENIE